MQAMSCHIPQIVSTTLSLEGAGDWTVYHDAQYAKVLSEKSLAPVLAPLVKAPNLRDFRQQIHLETTPFLMAVQYGPKEISFLSPRAHGELFLLENLKVSSLSKEGQQRYGELEKHVQRVLSMDCENFASTIEKVSVMRGLEGEGEGEGEVVGAQALCQELTALVGRYRRGFFERLSDFGLVLMAKYDLIRIHQLKFIAILSSLDFDSSGREVKRLLLEAFERFEGDARRAREKKLTGTQQAPPLILCGLFQVLAFIFGLIPSPALALWVRWAVKKMAKRFIAGENMEKACGELQQLLSSGRDATLDQLGELVVSSAEADQYCDDIVNLMEGTGKFFSPGEKNAAGLYRAHLSLKVSALCHSFVPHAFDETYAQVSPRLRKILRAAKKNHVFINIDAEHYHYRDQVLAIYQKVLLEDPQLSDYAQTGVVLQAYVRDADQHLDKIIALAKKRQLTLPIRLVKGAYWDAETVDAMAHSYDPPQFINKKETDHHFGQMMVKILKNFPHVQLCVGGHNLTDHCYSEALRAAHFPSTPPIEHQCLHMTYEGLSTAMARKGWVVRNYVPIGPLLVGMSYLVRRIMENSSQVGVLVQARSGSEKLAWPWREDDGTKIMSSAFFNTPPVRLFVEKERQDFEREWPKGRQKHTGQVTEVKAAQALQALERAGQAFEKSPWPSLPWANRSSFLLAVGQKLLLNRLELAGLIVSEAHKSWSEALADVDEAVDFVHFYARCPQPQNLVARGPVVRDWPVEFSPGHSLRNGECRLDGGEYGLGETGRTNAPGGGTPG